MKCKLCGGQMALLIAPNGMFESCDKCGHSVEFDWTMLGRKYDGKRPNEVALYESFLNDFKMAKERSKMKFVDEINKMIQELECSRGEVSDGSHTFNELYYHRMVLFAIICNTHQNLAWKSYTHADGEVWDGYFIVGVTTPQGNYTYHYQNQYWDVFNVKELEKAPEWDGHTAKDVGRLLSLIESIESK